MTRIINDTDHDYFTRADREEAIVLKAIKAIFEKHGFYVELLSDFSGPYLEGTDNLYVSVEKGGIFMQRNAPHERQLYVDIPLSDPDALNEDRIIGLWRSLKKPKS